MKKTLNEIIKENEQKLVEAWHSGIHSQQTEDIIVFLVKDKDDINIGTGIRQDFIESTNLIEENLDIQKPAPISNIPYIRNFWTIAVDTMSGENCLLLMSTFLVNFNFNFNETN